MPTHRILYFAELAGIDLFRPLRIGGVTFAQSTYVKYLARRNSMSYFLNTDYGKNALQDPTKIFACTWMSGDPDNAVDKALQVIRDKIDILSASRLTFHSRSKTPIIGLTGECTIGTRKSIHLDLTKQTWTIQSQLTNHPLKLTIDKFWKEFNRRHYFRHFISKTTADEILSSKWKTALHTAVSLIGRLNNRNKTEAYILNMIALEILISKSGEKYKVFMPEFLNSLFDWNEFWNEHFSGELSSIYDARNKFVHDGNAVEITDRRLFLLDYILFNLLDNIYKNPSTFKSKEALLKVSELIRAGKIVGTRKSFLPKRFGITVPEVRQLKKLV